MSGPSGRLHVVGEALVDIIRAADGSMRAVPGGGPFTLARAAARMGVRTSFGGGISTDGFGDEIAALLAADGVEITAPRTAAPTTLALARLDERGAATYTFYTHDTSAAVVTDVAPPDRVDVLAVGTLGLVLEPLAEAVEALVGGTDAAVFLDPNCRPSIIADRAAYLARVDRVLAATKIVKLSVEDAEYLRPGEQPRQTARELLGRGPLLVILTDGGAPTVALSADWELPVTPPTITVADTVGAGDTLAGAFLAAWLRAGSPDLQDRAAVEALLTLAVRAAAITCTRVGADPPTWEQSAGAGRS